MRIVFVIDMYDVKKNGTTMTARRFAEELRKHGHDVRVVSTGKQESGKYLVPERHIPVVDYFSKKQSFVFAQPDDSVLRKAMEGADLVHLFLPMKLEKRALNLATELQIPCSAAFHLQPENITYNIRMGRIQWLSSFIYFWMRKSFYGKFGHIHCPSEFIAEQLRKHHYRAKLHVISNGVTEEFQFEHRPKTDALFHILMIGRLSPEKRQDLLIKAAKQSKYSDRLQLHFAGTGPSEQALKKQGASLSHPPIFGYYQKEKLLQLIHSSDLYVHTSDAEIEAIACLEAVACGLVPVISNSRKSATSQFALDSRSTFLAGDASDLARKIDYWIEHPEEKHRMAEEYVKSTEPYRIEHSVEKAEQMFAEVLKDTGKKG